MIPQGIGSERVMPQQHASSATDAGQYQADDALVAARLAGLRARVGDRFNAEELAHLRRDLAKQEEQIAKLRTVPLTNADEPATIFAPYEGGEE